jgi:hypothetical protein
VQNQNPPITIPVPIYVKVSKKNTFSINLNEYRNAHFHVLNKAKVVFAEMIAPVLASIPRMNTTKLHFKLFFGSNRDVDTANVCSIVEKFFCDAMVSHGILEDDNRRFLIGSTSDFGGIDTKNPRVEVTFYDYDLKPKEHPPMRLVLTQREIADILIKHFLPILSGGEEKRGEFAFAVDDKGNPVGLLDILHPASPQETTVETPSLVQGNPAPKAPKARAASPTKPVAVQKVTLGDVIEAVIADTVVEPVSEVEVVEEDPGDKADIFDITPHQTAVEIENEAQEAEEASHEDQAADAGTKEETPAEAPAKPVMTLFPKGDDPKQVASPAAAAPAVDRRGLFAAQNGQKPTPKPEPAKTGGPVNTLFSGLAKPKHVSATSGT